MNHDGSKLSNGSDKISNMMELYQSMILEHNKNPRNFKKPAGPIIAQEGFNPVCGDHLFVYLLLSGDGKTLDEVAFEGSGCAISKASASLMTEALKGKTIEEAKKIFDEFHLLLTRKLDPEKQAHSLGKLEVFSGVWKYPARVKCAGLAWHTLKAALSGDCETVKTE